MSNLHRSKRRDSRRAVGGNSGTIPPKRARPAAPRFLVRLVGRAKALCLFNDGTIQSRHD